MTYEGDMSNLSVFDDESFDIIFHPVSNCFVPDINKVWKEAYRVLRYGGSLLSGFANPVLYLFDETDPGKKIEPKVVNKIPYSDLNSLNEEMKAKFIAECYPFEFGHSLDDQIGGQIKAGFSLEGFYEDRHQDKEHPLYEYIKLFISTRAVKRY